MLILTIKEINNKKDINKLIYIYNYLIKHNEIITNKITKSVIDMIS